MRGFPVAALAAAALPVVTAVAALAAAPAAAAPSAPPTTAAPAAQPAPKVLCTVNDPAMIELSGLAATADGYITMNDSNLSAPAMKVFVLDSACRRKAAWAYPGAPNRPLDPEDLAVGPDGTVWVADTGDNALKPERPTIALWQFHNGAAKAPPFRFTYPDGPHDGEALLLAGDGSPIFVTKRAAGPAGIYVPGRPLDPSGNPVPLRKAGEFQPQRTGTPNMLGVIGQNAVTGGANSPDGRHVALRTYSDAYEWDVTGGDVVGTITARKPRVLPLPNETMGEAIAYSRDSASLVTIADQTGPVKLLSYARPEPVGAAAAATRTRAPKTSSKGETPLASIHLSDITNLVVAIGVIGALMVIGGIVGIRRNRKRRSTRQADDLADGLPGRSGRGQARPPGGSGYHGSDPASATGTPYGGTYGAGAAETTGSRQRHGSTYSSGYAGDGQDGGAGHGTGLGSGRSRSAGSSGRVYPAGEYGGSTYGTPAGPSGYGSSGGHGSSGYGSSGGHGSSDGYGSGSGSSGGRSRRSASAGDEPYGGSRGSARVYGSGSRGSDQHDDRGYPPDDDQPPPPPRRARHGR